MFPIQLYMRQLLQFFFSGMRNESLVLQEPFTKEELCQDIPQEIPPKIQS
jgi:hypothetical protein